MTNPTEQVTQELLCPFRSAPFDEERFTMGPPIGNGVITKIRSMQFGPCLREKCAMWRDNLQNYRNLRGDGQVKDFDVDIVGYCGLAGKP